MMSRTKVQNSWWADVLALLSKGNDGVSAKDLKEVNMVGQKRRHVIMKFVKKTQKATRSFASLHPAPSLGPVIVGVNDLLRMLSDR
jgi:hypothetical protein